MNVVATATRDNRLSRPKNLSSASASVEADEASRPLNGRRSAIAACAASFSVRQAASLGLVPGASVTVVGHDLDGDLTVLVEPDGEEQDNPTRKVSPADAQRVYVNRP